MAKLPTGGQIKVVILAIRIKGKGFPLEVEVAGKPHHEKEPSQSERDLLLLPGGKYKAADIEVNGGITASEKYRDFKAKHDFKPRPGERICPVTRTKANPECTWVIDGRTYLFCCPPCISEFVALAKKQPEKLKNPKEYTQK